MDSLDILDKVLLIVGAGLSFGSLRLPMDGDFLERKYNEIIKEERFFLNTALNRLYSYGIVSLHWKGYRLEIVWSEIAANFKNNR